MATMVIFFKLLVENYGGVFFEDTTGAGFLAQWEQMERTIASDPQLSTMESSVQWPLMLSRGGFIRQLAQSN